MTYCTNIKDSDSMMWISFSKKQHPYLQYFIHEQQFIIISFYPSNKSEKFSQILQPWWLSLRNFWGISRESFPITYSYEFSRNSLELVPKMRDFCGITVFRLSFEKFLRNSPEFFPTKFLRISVEIFFRNSWEILRTLSSCLWIFRGIY